MKVKQTFVNLQEIIKLPEPDFQDLKIPLSKLAIQFRQKRVNELKLRGYSDESISEKTGSSLSTIEKDLHEIRERSRSWYEDESIKDFCLSLHDSIVLCDNAIQDLQILYKENDDVNSKLVILSKISEFEERKYELYKKTQAVQKFKGKTIPQLQEILR